MPWLIYTYNYFYDESIFYLPLLVLASLVIYVLGYIGIHKIGILNERKKIKSIEKDHSNLYTIVKEKKLRNCVEYKLHNCVIALNILYNL